MAVFFGLGQGKRRHRAAARARCSRSTTPRPGSQHRSGDQANALLDEIGLDKRDDDGHPAPAGRPARRRSWSRAAGESTLRDRCARAGRRPLEARSASRCSSAPRSATCSAARAIGGQIMMAIWSGIDNGVPTADMEPAAAGADHATASCNGRSGACTISSIAAQRARRPTCRRSSELVEAARRLARAAVKLEDRARDLAPDAVALHRPGVLDRHRQPARCSRWCRRSKLKNIPDNGALRLRPDRLSRRLHAGHLLARRGAQ